MCNLINLTTVGECRDDDGGVYVVLLNSFENVASFVFSPTTGNITNIVMVTTGTWKKYEFDTDDDTAYYNQSQIENSKQVSQEGFMKFGGLTGTMVEFADGIKACCRLIGVWFYNSGITVVQGVDVDIARNEARKSFKPLKARVNVLSGTSAEQSRVEVFLNSTGKFFSKTTTLSQSAILAL